MKLRQKVWYFYGLNGVKQSRLSERYADRKGEAFFVDDPKGRKGYSLYVGRNCFPSEKEATEAYKQMLLTRLAVLEKQTKKVFDQLNKVM